MPRAGSRRTFDWDEAARLFEAGGVTYGDLGKRYSVTSKAILYAIKKTAPHLMPSRSAPAPPDKNEVCEAYKNWRETYKTLGARFGAHPDSIKHIVRTHAPHLMRGKGGSARERAADEMGPFLPRWVEVEKVRQYLEAIPGLDRVVHRDVTYAQAAEDLNMPERYIIHIVKNNLPKLALGHRKYNAKALLELYKTGRYTYSDLAEMFGTTYGYIGKLLKEVDPEGIYLKGRAAWNKRDLDPNEVCRLLVEGLGSKAISAQLKVSCRRVSAMIEEEGWQNWPERHRRLDLEPLIVADFLEGDYDYHGLSVKHSVPIHFVAVTIRDSVSMTIREGLLKERKRRFKRAQSKMQVAQMMKEVSDGAA